MVSFFQSACLTKCPYQVIGLGRTSSDSEWQKVIWGIFNVGLRIVIGHPVHIGIKQIYKIMAR